MIKKLLTSLLMLVGFAMYAQAQQDTMYVVKEGKIVGTFEVGKDIDGITFKNPLTPSLEDFVISKHFTATPRIPPTLCVLKETSSRCSADVERLHFTTRLISGLRSL